MMTVSILMKDENQFDLVMEDDKAKEIFTEICDPDNTDPIVIDAGNGEGTMINRHWIMAASLMYKEDE